MLISDLIFSEKLIIKTIFTVLQKLSLFTRYYELNLMKIIFTYFLFLF